MRGRPVRISKRIAQAVDVGPAVDQVDAALGLLGGHVGGRAELLARAGRVGSGVVGEGDGARSPSSSSGRSTILARPQSRTITSPNPPSTTLSGFRSRWMTPRRVRVADRLADVDERLEQPGQLQRVGRPGGATRVVIGDRLAEGAAADEPHGVERLVVLGPAGQLVDGDDVGVFELPGDLGLLEEPPPHLGVVGLLGLDLLEGDLAVEVGVAGDPDLAQAPLGVQAGERVARPRLLGGLDERLDQDMAGGRGQAAERLADLGVVEPGGWRRGPAAPARAPSVARTSPPCFLRCLPTSTSTSAVLLPRDGSARGRGRRPAAGLWRRTRCGRRR